MSDHDFRSSCRQLVVDFVFVIVALLIVGGLLVMIGRGP